MRVSLDQNGILVNCGLGKIYTEQEIEQARQPPEFEREYTLK